MEVQINVFLAFYPHALLVYVAIINENKWVPKFQKKSFPLALSHMGLDQVVFPRKDTKHM